MPSITGSLSDRQPLVQVLISSAIDPRQAGQFTALIDTGCTITGISRSVVERLDLVHTTRRSVVTPGGEMMRKAYPFRVGFLIGDDATVGAARAPFFFPEPVLGADFVASSGFEVLLGMDLLSYGRLLFEGGRFEFSF